MIHKFCQDGVNIVMDVNSGAIHVVDDVVYDLADIWKEIPKNALQLKFPQYDMEQIEEAVEELGILEKEGMLYTKDDYEEVLPIIENHSAVVKALCLHVAHDCNLKCQYCFAEEGEYHGKRELMSVEVGKKALDFLVANSGSRKNLEVDFFGGEPLMNFDVVKELTAYGREIEKQYNKQFRFTITTNGILLDDEKQKFINENMHNMVLSLDGRKEVNDKMRPRAGGQGSYDVIVPKFQKAAESRNQTDYYIRGTFTKYNIDFYEDVIHMADLGFKQISVEPVVTDKNMPYAITEKELPAIFEEYEKLANEIYKRRKQGNDFNFFHFNIDLSGGPCVMKRLAGCGSGTEYLAVTPTGDLYPCHQFVGIPEFKMGTVYEGVTNTEQRAVFSKCNVYAKQQCRDCWAKFYCSGGCAANAYQQNGDILKPYDIGCKMQQKRIECAIMIKAKELLEEE
ncbi:thioether cross-link-forming SCIFF peptide maturase [Lachnospiraceae bacterium 46-61]